MPTRTIRREYNPGPYSTIEEIADANAATGHYWFDPDTMRSFGTRLGDGTIYAGRVFVSSDYTGYDRRGRAYTVRIALPDGSIGNIGGFLAFTSRTAAHKAAESIATATFEVRPDPYNDDPEHVARPDHYEWRVYAVPTWERGKRAPRRSALPIGTRRNTKAAATKLARLLTREQRERRRLTGR